MKYVGIETQQRRNNFRSLLLLSLFPCLVVGLVFLFCYLLSWLSSNSYDEYGNFVAQTQVMPSALGMFVNIAPWVIGIVLVWFLISYFANTQIIQSATSARPLERKDNKRVYNIVENLCMSKGMKMPKINVIDDGSLNAFASGINEKTYTITFSQGILDKLDDAELEGVAGHELTHIRNHDVRLLIVSIVFVGIFSLLAQMAMRAVYFSSFSGSRSREDKGGATIIIILLMLVVAAIGYFFTILMRFAISRNREYMADAGSAEMTKNPQALASALRKISGDPDIEAVTRADVAQLFIENPGPQASGFMSGLNGLFATHPPIEKRIQILEQF